MPADTPAQPWLKAVCIILMLTSVACLSWRVHNSFYDKPIDFLLFASAGKHFWSSGELYKRSENYTDSYHPSAAIYKFPPAFQLTIAPWYKNGTSVNLHIAIKWFMLTCYAATLLLLFYSLRRHYKLTPNESLQLLTTIIVAGCWLMPFFESIRWLLTEIPLLLIFLSSLLLFQRHAAISAALIAYAAHIKVYPLFLFGFHLFYRSKAALAGLLIASCVVIGLSLALFGFGEHRFYFETILPVLLNEPIITKSVNLNLEVFALRLGLIDEINGTLFMLTRLGFIGALITILIRYKDYLLNNPWLTFSLFVCTMYFCFPNYWPQYQLFLLLPIALLATLYIREGQRRSLLFLYSNILLLCIPQKIWILLARSHYDEHTNTATLLQQAELNGISTTLWDLSPPAWLFHYLFHFRALVPVAILVLLYLWIRQHGNNAIQ